MSTIPGAPARDPELYADTLRALDRVDPSNREALQLHYFAGLDARQVASRLGLPPAALSRRLAAGLRQFSAAFRDLTA